MSNSVKVTLYVALALVAGISGYFALTAFGQMMSRAGDRTSELEQIEPERRPAIEPEVVDTNNVSTNTLPREGTNRVNTLTNTIAGAITNENSASRSVTNTNVVAETAVPNDLGAEQPAASQAKGGGAQRSGHLGLWMGLFIVSVIALGLLIASDMSHYFGNRALKVLYNDEGDGLQNPEYDKAEEAWANGDHLGAIKLMREYLAKNPREQHVAIRIAEIYEKDLKNNLAAALEYEEVLKHKLAPERWGWTAIHLCNLYFRLNQEGKAVELLRRIVSEHPTTPAAEKARKRLEQVDGGSLGDISTEPQPDSPSRPGPASHLPPGFRPKK